MLGLVWFWFGASPLTPQGLEAALRSVTAWIPWAGRAIPASGIQGFCVQTRDSNLAKSGLRCLFYLVVRGLVVGFNLGFDCMIPMLQYHLQNSGVIHALLLLRQKDGILHS